MSSPPLAVPGRSGASERVCIASERFAGGSGRARFGVSGDPRDDVDVSFGNVFPGDFLRGDGDAARAAPDPIFLPSPTRFVFSVFSVFETENTTRDTGSPTLRLAKIPSSASVAAASAAAAVASAERSAFSNAAARRRRPRRRDGFSLQRRAEPLRVRVALF